MSKREARPRLARIPTANNMILEELDEGRTTGQTVLAQAVDDRPRRKVHQISAMYMKFSEIQLCIPTNTSQRKCLAFKIKTQVDYSETLKVDNIWIFKKDEEADEMSKEENTVAEDIQETHQSMKAEIK